MRCLTCHYDLKNLTEHRCPECGRAFDPDDPDTFALQPKSWSKRLIESTLRVGVCYFAALGIVCTVWVMSPGARLMFPMFMLGLCVALFPILVGIVFAASLARSTPLRRDTRAPYH